MAVCRNQSGFCFVLHAARRHHLDDESPGMEEAVKAAVAALNDLLSAERCAQLVEAIIRKFVALTPEEIQEWQVRRACCLCCC